MMEEQIAGLQWVIVNELAHYYTETDGVRWWNLSTVAGLYLKEKGPVIRGGKFYSFYLLSRLSEICEASSGLYQRE